MAQASDIHLYTAQTPNGIKVSIVLEELGLKYQTTTIEFSKNTQKASLIPRFRAPSCQLGLTDILHQEPWFLDINPNGRIPALTDTFEDGRTIRLFESASIMQYLVDRYDKDHKISYPYGTREYWEVNNWVFWQMGGLGPMQGQLNHFNRYAPERIEYGVNRYKNETRRLYRTMDTALAASSSGYLVGDRATIADFSCWGWVASAAASGVDINEFPALKNWRDQLLARPGLEKGRHVPSPHNAFEYEKLTEAEILERAEKNKVWVQAGMKTDAKK